MKKFITTLLILGFVALAGFFLVRPAVVAWMTSVPETAFDDTPVPEAPDYNNEDHWAALPWRNDSADWLPRGSGYIDQQASADVDVFFVYPTAAFYGDYWVAGLDNLLHRFAVDFGILPQHASAFNGVGKIYAPRYRSVRMPIWWAEDRDSVKKATDFAYADVKRAFEYYMKHWNKGRPIIIVSHSQGTLHTIRLIREYFDGKPLQKQLVAGYLIGNTIPDMPWFQHIPLCTDAAQSGCYVTWNTVLEGGDPYHWVQEKGLDRVDCVNPLSWKADQLAVDKSKNTGSIPMVSYGVLFETLEPMDKGVVGARCGNEGMLWIKDRPDVPGYSAALFGNGMYYHTYDINFYYESIRQNSILRTKTFLTNKAR